MGEYQLQTPVAFLIFNRPDTTARVFAEIARARPARLFVIADGPRSDHPDDVAGAAVSIAVNLLLIPGYGALGAAIATLLAQFTAVTLSTLFYRQTRGVFRMQLSSILLFRIFRP